VEEGSLSGTPAFAQEEYAMKRERERERREKREERREGHMSRRRLC